MEIRLTGSRFTKIECNRSPDFGGEVKIETNLRLDSIEGIKDNKDLLKVLYSFEINYGDLGKILIEGNVFFKMSPKKVKEIEKSWEKKEFNKEEHIAITNIILQKASIKAFELEEEFGLPLHVQLPRLEPKK